MKAQNWLYVSCLIGAFAVYGCGDDATSGGYYGSICGNGVVEDGESCDDGNSVGGDGCSADCKAIEPGYVCYEGKPCEQVSGVCGNGKVDDGEACDDGNQVNGDGCSADCKKVESGCKCPDKGGACKCNSEAICGNGVVEGDEMCDDDNTDDGDGCSADCMGIESGWECPPEGGKCYPKNGYCGDGIVNRVGEECDPGTDGLIGCTDDCKIRTGYDCETDSEGRSNCWEMGCGNAKVEPKNGEECDNGMGNNVEVGSYGFDDNGNPQCDNTCHFVAYCGDGTKNGDEECDNGSDNLDNAYQKDQNNDCTKQCKKAGWCGDGVYQKGHERCDPKDPKSNNGCTDECTPKEGYVCSAINGSCILKSELPEPECGNEYIDIALDEECDQNGNGCTDCKADKGYKCIASPKPCSECSMEDGKQCMALNCGDGIVDPDGYEQCDLGKDNGKGKGCSKTCTIDLGYACKTVQKDGKQTSVCSTVCGDGIRTPDEECDAGKNNGKGKGCSAACRIEDYAICTSNELGKTSKCDPGKCGDSEIGKGEVCDDGNSVGGDGCSADCKAVEAYFKCPKAGGKCELTKCGDGKLNDNDTSFVGEECDLGAGNGEGKGCTDFCRLEPGYECKDAKCTSVKKQTACGNGKLEGHEECDDGNKLGGDGCSPDCRIETGFECFNNDTTSASVCRPTCGDGIWNITSTKPTVKEAKEGRDLIEECDLGELNGQNLGCTIDCKLQEGYKLYVPAVDYPDTIELPVTFRDFKGIDVTADNDKSTGTNKNIGRADKNWIKKITGKYSAFGWNDCGRFQDGGDRNGTKVPLFKVSEDKGHPDFENMTGNLCTGILGSIGKGILGRDGKPVLTRDAMTSECADYERKIVNGTEVDSPGRKNKMVKNHIYCQASFDTWYRDDEKMNLNISNGKLLLAKQPGTEDTYVFDSANPPAGAKIVSGDYTYAEINTKLQIKKDNTKYYTKSYFAPLYDFGLNEGIVAQSPWLKDEKANGSFTTEIHTTIQYRGKGATLEFSGDDDVWVYLNNRLFVDVGGMHSAVRRSNSIKVETCDNGQNQKCDKTYGLYDGGIYDLKLFHAERARTASNFKLTLTGFVPTAKNVPSDFKSECGDGIVAVGKEECDYGDKKENAALYTLMSCDPKTCKKVGNNPLKTCGNGIVEPGEMCDTGFLCKEANYKKICEQYGLKFVEDKNCSNKCTIADSKCGNGIKESGEDCDLGKTENAKGEECTPDCKIPRCGDGYVNKAAGEECDMGDVENAKGIVCTEKCKFPYCGDGIVSEYNGEVCDDGINDGSYGHCGVGCTNWGPRCGDGIVDAGKEECDNGVANKDGKYGGCTTSCTWGPHCGDGIVQEGDNEECDEGANNGKPGSGCTVACRMIVN